MLAIIAELMLASRGKANACMCLQVVGRANRRQMATENLGNDESIYSQVVSELMLASRG